MIYPFPKFSELPLDASHPPHSAWGLWGPDDELGTLNHLTPERTIEAAKLITTGIRVGLNWPLEQMDYAGESFRQVLKHEIFELGKNMNVSCKSQVTILYMGETHKMCRMTVSNLTRKQVVSGMVLGTGASTMVGSITD
jgi:hypothetical protein